MSELTNFGFNMGCMKVTRTYEDKSEGKNLHVSVVSIETPKTKFSIRSTRTGFVRFYDEQGNECELVNKDYMNKLEKGSK